MATYTAEVSLTTRALYWLSRARRAVCGREESWMWTWFLLWRERKRRVAGALHLASDGTRYVCIRSGGELVMRILTVQDKIGHIDTILLSNSTWINENDPCVVYGMRGVVYANLGISSKSIDAHSGVDGGMVAEPMSDMVRLLGSISSGENGGVALPGFCELALREGESRGNDPPSAYSPSYRYTWAVANQLDDNVRPKSPSEMSLLSEVAKACDRPVEDLVKVWREPSFSIANISAGAAGNKTVIPRKVTADISMRIVPDQEMGAIVQGLKGYCEKVFKDLHSPNDFEVSNHPSPGSSTPCAPPREQSLISRSQSPTRPRGGSPISTTLTSKRSNRPYRTSGASHPSRSERAVQSRPSRS